MLGILILQALRAHVSFVYKNVEHECTIETMIYKETQDKIF